ncbi:MAG TPA: MlaD family protein [Steroidobacteraceae bacterium]|nr:MlaD family protein [Steroidobacteraceae bacterium]
MTDEHAREQADNKSAPRQASVRRGWWPGWIWGIPVAALIVVGWLGLKTLLSGNQTITIRFADSHDLKPKNSTVEFRGTNIGTVSDVKLDDAGDAVNVTVEIDDSATKFLRTGTRFWLRGASPSLSDPASLAAVLSGPTIVMEPGGGKKTTHFNGLEQQPVAPAGAAPVFYEVSFQGDVGSLKSGDPVKLHGFSVGEIRQIGFSYDAQTGELSMPTTIALYPSLFHIQGVSQPRSSQALTAAITQLVSKGLRARLDQNPPLVGSYQVTLEMLQGAPTTLPGVVDGMPQIPAESGGGLSSIVTRINKVPIEAIARNVLDATHQIDTIVASPHIKDAIGQLDAALRQIHQMTSSAAPQVPQIISRLRTTANDLDAAVKSAQQLVGGTATQNGLSSTVEEITDAARAVRSLADYLDRNPEALIKGRSDDSP